MAKLYAFILFFMGLIQHYAADRHPSAGINGHAGVNSADSFPKKDPFLLQIMKRNPGYFDTLLMHNEKWQISIIYTKIDRRKDNSPVFTDYYFNVDPTRYFYPASTVKMPVAVLSLQRLNELAVPGLDLNTTMVTDTSYSGQTAAYNDPDAADGRPTIAGYVKKIFLVSDNHAFNRLYEFLGQEYINNSLHKMGYDSAQVLHRLDISLTEDENRHTNPVTFYDFNSRIVYKQPATVSKLIYQTRKNLLGQGYYSGDKFINRPFDFSKKNRFYLSDLHRILRSILFPGSVPVRQRFNLKESDYHLLYKYMSMKPGESRYPTYDTGYNGAYSKLLLYGGKGTLKEGIRIFNKEGDAYGFLTDIAYVIDLKNNIEFMLSANILCNSDGIFNDDLYDYESTGYPFLKHLGEVIYQYELKRKRKNIPDLSRFRMSYGR